VSVLRLSGGKRRAPLLIALIALLPYLPGHAASPSFDCSKAESSAENLVCADEQLAALDRETARLFELARDGPHMTDDRRSELRAIQRGWIKRRDECRKSEELCACVLASYVIRIHELRQGYGDARSKDAQGISTGPYVVTCKGLDALIDVTFVNVDLPVAYLEWLDRSLVLTLTPSGSGARYAADHDDGAYIFWTKGNEALFELPGKELSIVTSRSQASLAATHSAACPRGRGGSKRDVSVCSLRPTRRAIFLGSARNGPASLRPRTTALLRARQPARRYAEAELRPVIPVLGSVCRCDMPVGSVGEKESSMGRGILLWLLGVPIPIIILILLFWH
jgi:uncharacterized protein